MPSWADLDERSRAQAMMYALPAFMVAPESGFRRWWDVVVLAAMLCCYVLPTTEAVMQLRQLPAQYYAADTPLVAPPGAVRQGVEVVLTAVLALDILVHLCTAVPHGPDSVKLSPSRNLAWRRYRDSRGFLIDVISALPMSYVAGQVSESADLPVILGTLRVFKLLKYPGFFVMPDRGMLQPAVARFYLRTAPILLNVFRGLAVVHTFTLGRLLLAPQQCKGDEPGSFTCPADRLEQYLHAAWWCCGHATGRGADVAEGSWALAYSTAVTLSAVLLLVHCTARWTVHLLRSSGPSAADALRSTLAIMEQHGVREEMQQEILGLQRYALNADPVSAHPGTFDFAPEHARGSLSLYGRVDVIGWAPLLKCQAEIRVAIADRLKPLTVPPGAFIVVAGDESLALHFLLHGFADVLAARPNPVPVKVLTRGDAFGDTALLAPGQRLGLSVRAITYCHLYRLERSDFQEIQSRFPELAAQMDSEARARGLHRMRDHVNQMAKRDPAAPGAGGGRSAEADAK